jgi:hypothetical protein
MIRICTVEAGTLVGFKALPSGDIDVVCRRDEAKTPSDWSAIYPQLWFSQAVNYLPNQWDRGLASAAIVALHSKVEFKVCVFDSANMSDVKISNPEKAALLRSALLEQLQLRLDGSLPLLDALGKVGLCLCIPDADNYELVVPHELFNTTVLSVEHLFSFSQSATRPGTVGSVLDSPPLAPSRAQERSILEDPALLGARLQEVLAAQGRAVACEALLAVLGIATS